MYKFIVTAFFSLFTIQSLAFGLSDLSNTEAGSGLKEALTQASESAVSKLGVTDGFLGNPKVKIPLPDTLKKIEKGMRLFGMGQQADELTLRMNRSAEAAVPEAKALLIDAVKKMSVQDAKSILTGADDAATQYFKKTTAAPLAEKFLPIVQKSTADLQVAQQYNNLAKTGAKFGLVNKDQADLDQYVTQKALDGLYLMMADEEKNIRKDPIGASSSLIQKVFGAIGK